MVTFSLVAGLVMLFVGGEGLVRGAVGTARALNISPLLIGLTVVAMATSAPELLVSLGAALDGKPALAVGNVVGSNIANILLILGVAALISPLRCPRALVYRDGVMMVVGMAIVAALAIHGVIEHWHGIAMLLMLAGFVVYTFRTEQREHNGAAVVHTSEADDVPSPPGGAGGAVAMLGLGLTMLLVGAELLIYGATETARNLGVSEAVIGLSLVAVGTSLPELASVSIAAWRGHSDVAVGNVIGSNIFNVFAILGTTSTVVPVPIAPEFLGVDIWVMLASSVLLLPLMLSGARICRIEGGLFLGSYVAYIGWLYSYM
jgi:cation:H+ antiporter